MTTPLLATKLYTPPARPELVARPRLLGRLNDGIQRKLTLISAPAGFGKTTLVSEWISGGKRPFAWLSLDDRDNDLTRFLTYLVAALRTLFPTLGERVLGWLESPQPLPTESLLTTLVNEIAALPDTFVLVLDDYHEVDAPQIDQALTFLLDHLPPQMHLVITTREDPNLPLARLRARGQLTELRANDLRFEHEETAVFLNQMMGLNLAKENIAALEARTEGWIAGLQLAALSLQGHPEDVVDFVQSFSGSHRFVLDYLVEEVLHQQSEDVQAFLLHTSILDRLCGPLCDAVLDNQTAAGKSILESLERANLFIVPLDNERRWYRYHHLFAELLRQRLLLSAKTRDVAELHIRASQWYETNGLELEAFHHAAAANDVARVARLIEGEGLPLYFRGEAIPVRHWLESLPEAEFKARPSLWVTYASVLTMTGRLHQNVEENLQAAETALQDASHDDKTNDLLGQIAAIRAMLGVPKNQVEMIITQSRRALELLHPDNAPMRTTTTWALGYAYQVRGDRQAARQAYREAAAAARGSGNIMITLAALTNLGQVQESELQLRQAAETYSELMEMADKLPWVMAYLPVVLLGLGRIHYQWNELTAVETYCRQARELAGELENVDTPAAAGILLARLRLAQDDLPAAQALLAETEQFIRDQQFDQWVGELTEVRIQVALKAGDLAAAVQLAQERPLPRNQARVALAQGDPVRALRALEPARQQAEAKEWAEEQLQAMVLQALSYQAAGEGEKAVQTVREALALAAPGGLLRLFVDEGAPMAALLREAMRQGEAPVFAQQVLAAFGETAVSPLHTAQPLPDPLSERELEVLKLLTTALTGPEIARELMISLNTMRTHTKNIYSKLGVNSRRTAVHRAEELKLI